MASKAVIVAPWQWYPASLLDPMAHWGAPAALIKQAACLDLANVRQMSRRVAGLDPIDHRGCGLWAGTITSVADIEAGGGHVLVTGFDQLKAATIDQHQRDAWQAAFDITLPADVNDAATAAVYSLTGGSTPNDDGSRPLMPARVNRSLYRLEIPEAGWKDNFTPGHQHVARWMENWGSILQDEWRRNPAIARKQLGHLVREIRGATADRRSLDDLARKFVTDQQWNDGFRPDLPATSISTDFSTYDTTNDWFEVTSTFTHDGTNDRISDSTSGAGEAVAIHRTPLSSADHEAWSECVFGSSNNGSAGVWSRNPGDGITADGYCCYIQRYSTNEAMRLRKFSGGTPTVLQNVFSLTVNGITDTVKLKSSGSTHKGYWRGTEHASQTDTTFPSGHYVGVFNDYNSLEVFQNSFAADDHVHASLRDGLEHAWLFEVDDDMPDEVTGHADFVLTSDPVTSGRSVVTGFDNNGVEFEDIGGDPVLHTTADTVWTLPLTIAGWIYLDVDTSYNSVLTMEGSSGDTILLSRDGNGVDDMRLRHSAGGEVTTPITAAAWHFVAIRATATTLSLTVDGTTVTDDTFTLTDTDVDQKLYWRSGDSRLTHDEWSMWSRELNDDELDLLYNTGTGWLYPYSLAAPAGVAISLGTLSDPGLEGVAGVSITLGTASNPDNPLDGAAGVAITLGTMDDPGLLAAAGVAITLGTASSPDNPLEAAAGVAITLGTMDDPGLLAAAGVAITLGTASSPDNPLEGAAGVAITLGSLATEPVAGVAGIEITLGTLDETVAGAAGVAITLGTTSDPGLIGAAGIAISLGGVAAMPAVEGAAGVAITLGTIEGGEGLSGAAGVAITLGTTADPGLAAAAGVAISLGLPIEGGEGLSGPASTVVILGTLLDVWPDEIHIGDVGTPAFNEKSSGVITGTLYEDSAGAATFDTSIIDVALITIHTKGNRKQRIRSSDNLLTMAGWSFDGVGTFTWNVEPFETQILDLTKRIGAKVTNRVQIEFGWGIERSGTINQPLAVETGSREVTVTLANHGLVPRDHIWLLPEDDVGGIDCGGLYIVRSVIDADQFTIHHQDAATVTAAAAGGVTRWLAGGKAGIDSVDMKVTRSDAV